MSRFSVCAKALTAVLLLGAGLFGSSAVLAERTSVGTEFVFPVFPNGKVGGTPNVVIAASEPTQVTVRVDGLNFSQEVTAIPGTLAKVPVPIRTWYDLKHDQVVDRAVQVSAGKPVKVFFENVAAQSSDAMIVLPVPSLGKRYRAYSYVAISRSGFAVTATQDNTTLTITPSDNTDGRPDGAPFSVTLNRMQTYMMGGGQTNWPVRDSTDMTGSLIEADKPVAVVSGNACANVPQGVASCDHLVEMMPPVASWGKEVATMPLASRLVGDVIRVMADEDDTVVNLNGSELVRLSAGEFHELLTAEPSVFSADKPIQVAQYSAGQGLDRTLSDPFMMLAVPREQFLSSYSFATPESGFIAHYVSLIVPQSATASMTLDGGPIDPAVFAPIAGTDLAGGNITLFAGSHTVIGSEPFGLYVYGFNRADSYGFPGGMAVEVLNGPTDDFADLVLQARVAAQGVVLDPASLNPAPDSEELGNGETLLTWRWDDFAIGDSDQVHFDLTLLDPQPGEQRVMLSDVALSYRDLSGTDHQRNLGPQAVSVLSSWLEASLALDVASVERGQPVLAQGGLRSLSTAPNTVLAQWQLQDASGTPVGVLDAATVTVPGGSSLPLAPISVDTAGLYAGQYQVVLSGYDDQGELQTRIAQPFSVSVPAAAASLEATVSVSQTSYQPGDTVGLDVTLANAGAGQALNDLSVTVQVLADDGTVLWQTTVTVDQLLPGSSNTLHFEPSSAGWPPGTVTTSVSISDADGVQLGDVSGGAPVAVESSAETGIGVGGTLALTTAEPLRNEPVTLTADVVNTGNAPISGVPVRVLLVNPVNNALIDTLYSGALDIIPGAAQGWAMTWQSGDYPAGVYAAVMEADFPAGTRTLDFVPLPLSERYTLSLQQAAQPELLVLTDREACFRPQINATVTLPVWLGNGDEIQLLVRDVHGRVLDTEQVRYGLDALPVDSHVGEVVDIRVEAADAQTLSVTVNSEFPRKLVLEASYWDAEGVYQQVGSQPFWNDCVAAQYADAVFGFEVPTPTCLDGADQLIHHPHLFNGYAHSGQGEGGYCPTLGRGHAWRWACRGIGLQALQTELDASGWQYTMVFDESAFTDALASGRYEGVVLASRHHWLSHKAQAVLRSEVENGLKLLITGLHDWRYKTLAPALGVSWMGNDPKAYGWQWDDGLLPAGEANLRSHWRPANLYLHGAQPLASWQRWGFGWWHKAARPAVTRYDFGAGESIVFGFDLLREMALAEVAGDADGGARAWLTAALDHFRVGSSADDSTRRLTFTLTDRGNGGDLLARMTLPQGYVLRDAGNARLSGDVLLWPLTLVAGEGAPLDFVVDVPNGNAASDWSLWIDTIDADGQASAYGEISADTANAIDGSAP